LSQRAVAGGERASARFLLTSAHSLMPSAYPAMLANSARLRPTRSVAQPDSTAPAAQLSSLGMQLGATTLKRRA
jgi:hypothetical protein